MKPLVLPVCNISLLNAIKTDIYPLVDHGTGLPGSGDADNLFSGEK